MITNGEELNKRKQVTVAYFQALSWRETLVNIKIILNRNENRPGYIPIVRPELCYYTNLLSQNLTSYFLMKLTNAPYFVHTAGHAHMPGRKKHNVALHSSGFSAVLSVILTN
jgi:hypothetical protein